MAGRESWTLPAFCQACRIAVEVHGDWLYSDGRAINFRERLLCPSCQLNNRQRFMAQLLRTAMSEKHPDAGIYLYEQVTPFYTWAVGNLEQSVVGSEYLGHDVPGGSEIDGIRHEDDNRHW